MPKNLTPQQKKVLSYKRDRRNAYGQNAKASRKAIPLRKASARRAYRHAANQTLKEAVFAVDAEQADTVQAEVASVVDVPFRKFRDIPLGKHVEYHLKRRERLAVDSGEKARRRRLAEALRIFWAESRDRRRALRASLEDDRAQFQGWLASERSKLAAELAAAPAFGPAASAARSHRDRGELALRRRQAEIEARHRA
ncbi:MAG: hypothetical protein KGL74_03670 [Elusimicrobia bacterium]|nr:hypothetical protein [Elusimicrobiota bacterium]MDE2510200.1 hypothetical protein [Elusimicrobiota bacterium]